MRFTRDSINLDHELNLLQFPGLNEDHKVSIRLILSGHTHGGQIQFLGREFYKPRGSGRYLEGWYRSEQSLMYVSRGVGTSYLPIRFGGRAEAPIFYL